MSPARILKPIDDSSILHDQLLASLFVVWSTHVYNIISISATIYKESAKPL